MYYELDRNVRNLTNNQFRVYEIAQVERMRERLARTNTQIQIVNHEREKQLIDAINEYRQELRKEKKYEVSDKLRNILVSFKITVKDQ